MRPVRRRFARAVSAGVVLAALVTSLLPALPALAKAPVKVTGREVVTSVEAGRHRVVPLPITASHVALRWQGDHDAQIAVAFANRPNEFGEDVPVNHSEDSDHEGEETYSSVLWTGGARFVRVASDRPLGRLAVIAIDAQSEVGFVGGGIAVASAAMNQPAVISRESWGADESLRFDRAGNEAWPPSFSPMQKAIVHHTAGRNGDPNPAATVRAIYYLYAITKDYGDMGYNFLIDEQGRIYEGRYSRPYAPGETPSGEDLAGNVVRGAHAKNFNDGTVGIVLLGTFMNRQPTNAARNALERLLAWKLERHGIDPLGQSVYRNPVLGNTLMLNNISGHRNVNPTACPGDSFYPTFPQLRRDVADRISGTTGPGNDDEPPTLTSFTSMATNPTGSHTIPFGLAFDEPVTGLDPADFALAGSSAGWTVSGISGSGSTYTIEVTADDPTDGTIELVLAADVVADLAGLAGPAAPATAAAAYALDEDAPTVELDSPARKYINDPAGTYNDPALTYINATATFSEPISGFRAQDVVIGGTSHAANPWKIPIMFGSGASYGFNLENYGWSNGTLTFQVPAGAVSDLAGNPVAASNVVSIVFDRSAPTTSAPKARLTEGATLGGSSLPVTLRWSASDVGPAGIASYELKRSKDGGAFKPLGTVSGKSAGTQMSPGHTYRYEVRARDKAGNVGPWKAGPTVTASLIQQTSDKARFSGPTKATTLAGYSAGSQRYLAEAGSFVKLTTTARSLSFVTTTGANRGEARIYVDGVLQATIDLGAAETTYRFVAFTKTWSSPGEHTIKVVAVGTAGRPRVDVDAFGVIR